MTANIIGFTPYEDSTLTLKILESVAPASWRSTTQWGRWTELTGVADPDKSILIKHFGSEHPTISTEDRVTIREYLVWVARNKEATPDYHAIDKANASGQQVIYTESVAKIPATSAEIPISRVPLDQSFLAQKKDGSRAMRIGSDILALSLASCTRWSGKKVLYSFPEDAVGNFKFSYVHPTHARSILDQLPEGASDTGMKGRSWAYYLMTYFQTMDISAFYALQSAWIFAIFNLKKPSANVILKPAVAENIAIITHTADKPGAAQKMYYVYTAKKPSLVRQLEAYLPSAADEESLYHSLMRFNSVRQGDNNGLSLLSGSRSTWGLPSSDQVMLEQIVSLLVGMEYKRIVIAGLSAAHLVLVRHSVNSWIPTAVVYELSAAVHSDEKKKRTHIMDDSLVLTVGNMHIPTSVPPLRMGSTVSYQKKMVLEACWEPVEVALNPKLGNKTLPVYYGAALPSLDTKLKISSQSNTWNSVFFVSHVSLKGAYIENGERKSAPIRSFSPVEAYKDVIEKMNWAVSYWALPPVNTVTKWVQLMCFPKADKNVMVTGAYNPDDGEFVITYSNSADFADAGMADSDSQGDDDDDDASSQEDDDEDQEEEEEKPPVQPVPRPRRVKPVSRVTVMSAPDD